MSTAGKTLIRATLLLLVVVHGVARAQEKIIQWSPHPQGSNGITAAPPMQLWKQIDEIEISGIDVEDAPVIIGQPFKAGSEWLKHITFKVKNNSAQAVTYLQVTLTLPQ